MSSVSEWILDNEKQMCNYLEKEKEIFDKVYNTDPYKESIGIRNSYDSLVKGLSVNASFKGMSINNEKEYREFKLYFIKDFIEEYFGDNNVINNYLINDMPSYNSIVDFLLDYESLALLFYIKTYDNYKFKSNTLISRISSVTAHQPLSPAFKIKEYRDFIKWGIDILNMQGFHKFNDVEVYVDMVMGLLERSAVLDGIYKKVHYSESSGKSYQDESYELLEQIKKDRDIILETYIELMEDEKIVDNNITPLIHFSEIKSPLLVFLIFINYEKIRKMIKDRNYKLAFIYMSHINHNSSGKMTKIIS